MIYRGRVKNGVIVLEDDAKLPDGTEVKVEPVQISESADPGEGPTLYQRFKDVIGKATGLPEDFAEQHDHYIHGTPKKWKRSLPIHSFSLPSSARKIAGTSQPWSWRRGIVLG